MLCICPSSILFVLILVVSFMKSSNALSNSVDNKNIMRHCILCLHGKMQSASTFSSKIGGARRKLERVYDLDFVDGPIDLTIEEGTEGYAWWVRNESTGEHLEISKAFEYIKQQTSDQSYDAILGFSQGGTLATALALSGTVPGVRAVVTAGAPYVPEMMDTARQLSSNEVYQDGLRIPKFHFAGIKDEMISVESTRALCEEGGNGILQIHDQGHLFPTRAQRVQQVLEFLERALSKEEENANTDA